MSERCGIRWISYRLLHSEPSYSEDSTMKGDLEGLVNEPLRIKLKFSVSLREDDRRQPDSCEFALGYDDFPCSKWLPKFFQWRRASECRVSKLHAVWKKLKWLCSVLLKYADRLKLKKEARISIKTIIEIYQSVRKLLTLPRYNKNKTNRENEENQYIYS